jgi:hypothetical protein
VRAASSGTANVAFCVLRLSSRLRGLDCQDVPRYPFDRAVNDDDDNVVPRGVLLRYDWIHGGDLITEIKNFGEGKKMCLSLM